MEVFFHHDEMFQLKMHTMFKTAFESLLMPQDDRYPRSATRDFTSFRLEI